MEKHYFRHGRISILRARRTSKMPQTYNHSAACTDSKDHRSFWNNFSINFSTAAISAISFDVTRMCRSPLLMLHTTRYSSKLEPKKPLTGKTIQTLRTHSQLNIILFVINHSVYNVTVFVLPLTTAVAGCNMETVYPTFFHIWRTTKLHFCYTASSAYINPVPPYMRRGSHLCSQCSFHGSVEQNQDPRPGRLLSATRNASLHNQFDNKHWIFLAARRSYHLYQSVSYKLPMRNLITLWRRAFV